ncbi:hypothetical protein BOTU111921_10905 [Bordetella tumbae]|uniref:hypothetical protein n=1 Tax=Bordetella tumbae TaxID=1649139 RepID=UPI0039F032D5
MSITPVDSSSITEPVTNDAAFDDAVKNAKEDPESSEALDQVIEQGVGFLMQTIVSPRMNEILSEATSDE